VVKTLRGALAERGEAGWTHVVAETGLRDGSPMAFHKSHRLGLTADVHLPVRNGFGWRTTLHTWPWTLWGYLWRFDDAGRSSALALDLCRQPAGPAAEIITKGPALPMPGWYEIDFDELAAFLRAVDDHASKSGVTVRRVALAPALQKPLFRSKTWKAIPRRQRAALGRRFFRTCRWFLHDEHVHFTFSVRK